MSSHINTEDQDSSETFEFDQIATKIEQRLKQRNYFGFVHFTSQLIKRYNLQQ